MQEPKAIKLNQLLEEHGFKRNDPYYWLREKENPAVIQYLNDENAYTKSVLKHTENFQEKLF